LDAALQIVNTDRGKDLMKQVEAILAAMSVEEPANVPLSTSTSRPINSPRAT
jgi:CHASE3 domain sensor protein